MNQSQKNKLLVAALVISGMFGASLARDYVSTLDNKTYEKLCQMFNIGQKTLSSISSEERGFVILASVDDNCPKCIDKESNN